MKRGYNNDTVRMIVNDRPLRCTGGVSETDDGSVARFIQVFDADFDVVDERHSALFEVQNDEIVVDVRRQVRDEQTVQHRRRTRS